MTHLLLRFGLSAKVYISSQLEVCIGSAGGLHWVTWRFALGQLEACIGSAGDLYWVSWKFAFGSVGGLHRVSLVPALGQLDAALGRLDAALGQFEVCIGSVGDLHWVS